MGQTASNQPGEQRRRSTRLIETVPLTVRGVDLLGQPFEERTSTLVINFHGCRYPSKHHLPKNTWVTLEIPDPAAERERRCLRARVAWIQRPRSVRELFQIGVELESPGNVWGVVYPPEDWAMPASSDSVAVRAIGRAGTRESELELPGFTPPAGSLPAPLATYIERLLADARQKAPGEEAGGGIATAAVQASPLLREVREQLQQQTEKTLAEAESRTNEMIRQAMEEIQRECRAGTEAIQSEMGEGLERLRKDATAVLGTEFAEAIQAHQESLSREWEGSVSRARDLLAQVERQASSLRAEIAGLSEGAATRFEQIHAELESAEAAARQRAASESTDATSGPVRAAWREQMQQEMAVAREQWNELLQSSLDGAVQRLVTKLAEASQGALAGAEQRMALRLSEMGAPITQLATDARETLSEVRGALEQEVGRARTSLGEIEQAANRMSEYSAQLEAASQDTVNELHRRLDSILAAQVSEMTRRSESLVAGAAEKLQPQLKITGQEFIRTTVAEVEAKMAPRVERAQDVLRQLSVRAEQIEETLRVHRERLRQASEQNQRECANLMSACVGQLQTEFEETRREALTKWTEELDASGARATHAAAEKLAQSSEWYEKKAQSDLDQLVQAAIEKGGVGLEEKSGEVIERVLEELREQRAGQLGEAKVQLEAVASEALESSRGRFAEAAAAAARSFGGVLQEASATANERFAESNRAIVKEQTAQVQASADRARQRFEEDANQNCEQTKARLAEAADQRLAEAQKSLAAQLVTAIEEFSSRRDSLQEEWLTRLAHLGNESASQFEERLRSACDSWMVTSLRKLSEHGQNVLESLSKSAEQSLRQTCSSVFDGLADTLREKLLGTPTRTVGASAAVDTSGVHAEKHRKS